MKTRIDRFLINGVLFALAAWPAAGAGNREVPAGREAPLFDDLGDFGRPIRVGSPLAQRYFDQGLILAYGFNHAEAARSFREATKIDPDCAMCWWGLAYVLGPNINAPMEDSAVAEAYAAAQKAVALARDPAEQAFAGAIAQRYAAEPPADRAPLDQAFADAMREVARGLPDDLDARTIFAESLMNTTPWNYWTEDALPRPQTTEILTGLESVLERDPDHPGALHLYIHAVEASATPERGEPAADRLRGLVPGAGHLVHMPSHIYQRVGRYHDSAQVNEDADRADASYIAQCRAQGLYPLAYHSHNIHFIWAATTMEGRSADAVRAAWRVREKIPHDLLHDPDWSTLQFYWTTPLFALARFGRWEEILAEPAPDGMPFAEGIWRYARGKALLARGQSDEAAAELARVREIAADPAMADLKIWGFNSFASLLGIASEVLAGELAARRGEIDRAVEHLERGAELEDDLVYQEPPDWHHPVRQTLGAVLLEAGRPAEAEVAFRHDLEKNPGNGWSSWGLVASLRAQGKEHEAAEVQARLREAWQSADIVLTSARF